MGFRKKEPLLHHILVRLYAVMGIVLVWRGVWYLLDEVDRILFGGSHGLTAVLGVILGVILLLLPDRDLKEIEKL